MRRFLDKFIRSIPYFHDLLLTQKVIETDLIEIWKTECDHCKLLQGQLDYERERTTHLLDLLTPKVTTTHQKAIGTKSWASLQHEMESKGLKAVNDREEE